MCFVTIKCPNEFNVITDDLWRWESRASRRQAEPDRAAARGQLHAVVALCDDGSRASRPEEPLRINVKGTSMVNIRNYGAGVITGPVRRRLGPPSGGLSWAFPGST
jgi:hypothetical protein